MTSTIRITLYLHVFPTPQGKVVGEAVCAANTITDRSERVRSPASEVLRRVRHHYSGPNQYVVSTLPGCSSGVPHFEQLLVVVPAIESLQHNCQ